MFNFYYRLNDDGGVQTDNDYSYYEYSQTSAHEFGHVLGLADAYQTSKHSQAPWNRNGFSEGPKGDWMTGDIMRNNGYVTSNDIEMMLEAWKTNSWQAFVDDDPAAPKSPVIRSY